MRKLIIFFVFLIILAGCNSSKEVNNRENSAMGNNEVLMIGNPNADKVLKMDPNANILMYQNIVYNAGVQWVNDLKITKDKLVTEITQQSEDGKDFENGTANKLTVGTKIYSVKERNDILIAATKHGDIRFYNLVEG